MLEHQKLILKRVSSNQEMFRKELEKSINWLRGKEIEELYQWLLNNFREEYGDLIKKKFEEYAA